MEAEYRYEPLPGPRFTRLVEVLPGGVDDPLDIQLRELDCDTKTSYVALSYVWGQTHGTVPLKCAGKTIMVTPNLEIALRQLRSNTSIRTMWIDALSINQNSTAERNSQVRMMRDIYHRAQKTIMFLGPAIADTGPAYSLLADLVQVAQKHLRRLQTNRWFWPSLSEDVFAKELNLIGKAPWDGMVDLLKRPYFIRVWIMQEILTSKNAYVYCGEFSYSWSLFKIAVATAGSTGVPDYYRTRVRDAGTQLALIHVSSIHPEPTISHMLSAFQNTCASDPRDKVYVFWGLASFSKAVESAAGAEIIIDYNRSVHEVYTNIAMYMICEGATHAWWQYHSSKKRIPSLPSWVPDWSQMPTPVSFVDYTQVGLRNMIPYAPRLGSKCLFIDGCIVDRIQHSVSSLTRESMGSVVRTINASLGRRGLVLSTEYPKGICTSAKPRSRVWTMADGFRLASRHSPMTGYPSFYIEALWKTLTWKFAVRPKGDSAESIDLSVVSKVFSSIILEGSSWGLRKDVGKRLGGMDEIQGQRTLVFDCIEMLRDLYLSDKGYFGLGALDEVREGMFIAILAGTRDAWILERTLIGADAYYRLVCPTYTINLEGITELPPELQLETLRIH